ncbi:MAG: hypothetical protein GY810_19635 [Aureispira sp.]|nr:hypothetical protein [Aureispira sp.]
MGYTDTLKADQKEAIRLMKVSMVRNGITNDYMQAAIIAVVSKESGMRPKSEGGYGGTSLARIRKVFGKKVKDLTDAQIEVIKKDDEKFFNHVYGNRGGNGPNEGYKYRGRGLNQLTFKGNYKAMMSKGYTEEDIVSNPDLVNTMPVAVDCLIGYYVKNFVSGNNKLEEYGMLDGMNSATSAKDAVGAAYHANAGWGKNKEDLDKSTANGYKRAFARVDDLVNYVNTVHVDVVPGADPTAKRDVILKSVGIGGVNDSPDVKAVQRLLKKEGYDLGKYGPKKDGIDGDCGKTCKKHIKAFQTKKGIEVTGLIKPQDATWKALGGAEVEPAPNPIPNPTPTPTPSPTPTPEPSSERKNILSSVGEGGNNELEDVKVVQRLLKKEGFDMGSYGPNKDGIDGDCGKTTKKHIKQFQTDKGIAATGLINPADATWKALAGETTTPVDDTPTDTDPTPAPTGDKIKKSVGVTGVNDKNDVMIVQRLLKKEGFDLGKYGPNKDGIDGDCGKTTQKHIKQFQTDNGIEATGNIEPADATWNALSGTPDPAHEAALKKVAELKALLEKWFGIVNDPTKPDPKESTKKTLSTVEKLVDRIKARFGL